MKETIKPFGLFASLVVTTIGVGVFAYPRELAETVQTNGWIITLLAGGIFNIIVYIINKLIKLNNYNSFNNIIVDSLGKWVGYIVIFLFVFYLILATSIQVRSFVTVLNKYLLERTPTEFLLVTIILSATLLTSYSKNTLAKFNQVSFFIMFIPTIFIGLVLIKGCDITNVLPIGQVPVKNYFQSLYSTVAVFAGFEIMFLFSPMLDDRKKILKSALSAGCFIGVFYCIVVIFSLSIFSQYELKKIIWPTITMVTAVEIPGAFIERWEGIIMALWIFFNFTTVCNVIFFSANIVKESFNLKKEKIVSVIFVPIIYALALYPSNTEAISNIEKNILLPIMILNIIILPIILLIATKIRIYKKGGIGNEK